MRPDNVMEKMETKKIKVAKKKSRQKWPKVAIIILNWNGWKDTIECLESVFRNTYPNYQVIVVDNGSTDDSVEKIKAWADGKQEVLTPEPTHPLYHLSHPPVKKPIPYIYYTREEAEKGGNLKLEESIIKGWQEQKILNSKELYPTSDYPLIFIQTGENLGFAGGNNVGIYYSLEQGAEYVLILNNDTIVEPIALMSMVEVAKETKASIVGALIKDASGEKSLFVRSMYPQMLFYSESQMKVPKKKWWFSDQVQGSAMLLCHEFLSGRWQSLGYFLDDSLFLYCEEVELALWCRQVGRKSVIAGNAIVYHKLGTSSGGRAQPLQFYYLTRNRILLAHRYLGGLIGVLFTILYPTWRIIRAGVYIVQGKYEIASAIFQGLIDGIKGKVRAKL